jgi:hypothetical protein
MPVARIVYGEGEDDFAQFLRIEGQPQKQSRISLPFSKPGTNGLGATDVASQGKPFRLIGLRTFDDNNDASTDLLALKSAIEGVVCSIFDAGGVEFTNMLCLECDPKKAKPLLLATDGSGAICAVDMVFVHLGETPEE